MEERRVSSSGKCQMRTQGGCRGASSGPTEADGPWSAAAEKPERPAAAAASRFNRKAAS